MSDLAVKLDGVGKDYRFFSLDDVHLEIPDGHIMGFIGPNGAGKSTTIRILMGLVHQDRGQVHVLGHPMPAEQAAAKWDVGFASEDMRQLYDTATLDWQTFASWNQIVLWLRTPDAFRPDA
jgi:ABC-2 type transport system ATP-binding protein